MSWRVAVSLNVLLGEVNALAPNRSKVSDGSIGDAAHAARTSDHNPWVIDADGVGVVRARDFTHDPAGGLDCNDLSAKLADLLGRHPALGADAYVIWNRRIISTNRITEGWREYTGSNDHTHHCHVSVTTNADGYDSLAPWLVEPTASKSRGVNIDRALRRLRKARAANAERPRRLSKIQAAIDALRSIKPR